VPEGPSCSRDGGETVRVTRPVVLLVPAARNLVAAVACLIVLGCSGKHPVDSPTAAEVFDPHPTDGPPNPDTDVAITVEGREFSAPVRVMFTLRNTSTRPLMYWPQCWPPFEVWEFDHWVVPPQICNPYWPGTELAPGESHTGAFEFRGHGAFRVALAVSDSARAPSRRVYRSSWWIVR
jgi:hypothetical protein